MEFSSTQDLHTHLIELFDPVKDLFPEYGKIYEILTTYKVVPKVWLESLYAKTISFGLEQYHHYVDHVHDQVHARIHHINTLEAAEAEDADAFLQQFLDTDE